jgi:hypothetical protein
MGVLDMEGMQFVLGFLSGAAIVGLTIIVHNQESRRMREALMKIRWACAAELVTRPLTVKIQNLASIGLGDYFSMPADELTEQDGRFVEVEHGRA